MPPYKTALEDGHTFSLTSRLKAEGITVEPILANSPDGAEVPIGWIYGYPDGSHAVTVAVQIGRQNGTEGTIVYETTRYNPDGDVIAGPSITPPLDRPI
ncbi:hypothetical protein H6764_00670 [Candidatus Nomurabacteria bacterium]|nr:hypothetical protein [Candidatus Nomurabacteria bacterium]